MDRTTAETDVIVIGSGVSGLAAALTSAEGGAKVIVFEKQRSLGGTSNFFDGMFAVESEMQRQRYIKYSRDEAFRKIMEYSHWRANARLVRAFVNESGGTIAWLQEKGVEFSDATINMPDAPRTYHVVKGQGAAVVKALSTRAKEKGVDLRLAIPVQRILKEGGRVAGVIAEENGEDMQVAGKVVIIASGGYANNKEWIKKYAGFDLDVNVIPVGNVDKMGDGIRMAWEVGAAEEGLGVLELFRVGPVGPEFAMKGQIEFIAAQPDLWVNPRGERFCDEGIAFYDTSVGNANARQKEGFTYSLFDESIKAYVIEKGIDRGVGMDNPPGTRPVDFDKELNAAVEKGSTEVFVADSIEELAGKMGVNPTVLKTTVLEYNGFCEKGHDDFFAKDPRYLRPLKGPKFYAVKARTVFLGTLGGIKINHKMEVVDKKGKVIPGLYAVGFDAGGMWGDSYSIRNSSGASAGFATNSGRIAGKNALKYIGK
ncbi:MAG: FAD-dependent oxidoreductase [Thermodesulfobacteriota bacterium]|jgi:fumarate reductase flavoprotein subunit